MNRKYPNDFLYSLAVHGLFLIVLLLNVFLGSPQIVHVGAGKEKQEQPIIQAGLIDKQAIKTAINRQEQQERDKQHKLALQKEKADKLKKEAENMKLEAQKLKQQAAIEQKQLEKDKQLALEVKAEAEKATLQAIKEHEKAKLAKEQAAKKLAKAKQIKEQVAKEREQEKLKAAKALEEQAKIAADKQKQAEEQTRMQQQQAERNRWIDSEFTRFVDEMRQSVFNNRTLSSAFPPELVCKIQVKLLPDGSVHDVRILQSSGNAAYDAMGEEAVYKAAPFNMPEDKELISKLRDVILEFTNENT
jgi:colicin import membrane protein